MSMPASIRITIEDSPNPQDAKAIRDGLVAYNLRYAPDDRHRHFAIFARDAEEKLVGGLLGETYWNWLYIEIFWLEESLRQQGLGTEMLNAAEAEALRRGCQHAHLDTFDFQARPFYENHGYTVFGVLEDLPPGHTRYFLKKDLSP